MRLRRRDSGSGGDGVAITMTDRQSIYPPTAVVESAKDSGVINMASNSYMNIPSGLDRSRLDTNGQVSDYGHLPTSSIGGEQQRWCLFAFLLVQLLSGSFR